MGVLKRSEARRARCSSDVQAWPNQSPECMVGRENQIFLFTKQMKPGVKIFIGVYFLFFLDSVPFICFGVPSSLSLWAYRQPYWLPQGSAPELWNQAWLCLQGLVDPVSMCVGQSLDGPFSNTVNSTKRISKKFLPKNYLTDNAP